jgi:hypothetical protein
MATNVTEAGWRETETGLLLPSKPKPRNQKIRPADSIESTMNPTHPDTPSEGASIPAVATPGTLYLSGPPDVGIESLIQLLQEAGLDNQAADAKQSAIRWQALSGSELLSNPSRIQEAPNAHLLLFFQSPETVLARAMDEGRSPDEALSEWLETAESTLALIRQNRRRITLVEMTLALQNPNNLIERLNQRLSLALTSQGYQNNWPVSSLDPIHLLIAHNAVTTHTQARRLASELQATAIPIGQYESLLPDALSAWDGYRSKVTGPESEQKEKSSEEFKDLQEENELLLLQLHHVQEELESYYLDGRDIQQKYEKAESERKKLERDHNTALQRARMLQQRIDAMRASRSWRITKPLRVGNIFKRSKKK